MRVQAMCCVMLWLAAVGCGASEGGGVAPAAPGLAVFQRPPQMGEQPADAQREFYALEEESEAGDEFGVDDGFDQTDSDSLGELPPPARDDAPLPDESAAVDTSNRNVNDTADTATDAASAEAAADAEAAAEAEAADMDAYVARDPRCRFLAPDTDGDGLCDAIEAEYGTEPLIPDTDEDGLSDGMEVRGWRIRRTRDLVILPGANPLHKDIYVEIDYTPGWRPSDAAIQDVTNAFAAAPVENKDGVPGITLHAQVDDVQLIQQAPDNIRFPEDFDVIKQANFQAARSPAYHYALFAKQYNSSGSSGVAWPSGVDLMVTLGSFENTQVEQAGTFMHELGHSLGLPHGGIIKGNVGDETNFKPNYLSIMSYNYQTLGVPRADGSVVLDYSRGTVGAISESSLSELAGLAVNGTDQTALAQYAAPIICLDQVQTPEYEDCNQFFPLSGNPTGNLDFNLSYCIDQVTIAMDLNGFNGTSDTFPEVLDDWTHLHYGGSGIIGDLRRIGARVRTVAEPPVTCMNANTARAVSRFVVNPTPPLCSPTAAE